MIGFVLDLRSAPEGGAVVPARLTPPGGSLDQLQQCGTVAFLVHGFNVNRATATGELQAFGTKLVALGSGAAVSVLWPGDSVVGPLCYPFETNKADDSAVELATFISDSLPQRPAISFIGHSLGCRVVMETVRHLWIKDIPVAQVCVMAAAVDNDSLACAAEYFNAARYATRVAVLSSPADQVLQNAYPIGNLISAFLHWISTTDAALGYTGPRTSALPPGTLPPEVQGVAIPAGARVNHGDYLPDPGGAFNDKQLSAARFANAVIAGLTPLVYS
ncbi:MAG TPA: alpha/beta hydrolase [Steroidobacteraceae bacterium]|nr:alpha/beta hydrolase [Steroidobacteraceae bacterium]